MPIHDHLHWSLVLVAHPGWLPGTDPDREQCIIHFDSMEGGEQHWQPWLRTTSDHLRAVLPAATKRKGNDRMTICCSVPGSSVQCAQFSQWTFVLCRWSLHDRRDESDAAVSAK